MGLCKKIKDIKPVFSALAILSIIILFINAYFWQNSIVGIPWTVCLFLILSFWLGEIFGYFFNWGKEAKFLVGLFLTFYLLAFGLAVPITLFKISLTYFYTFLLILVLAIFYLNIKISNFKYQIPNNSQNSNSQNNDSLEIENCGLIENWKLKIENYVLYSLWFILYVIGWILIIKSRTGSYVVTPWNVLSKYYQIIWFALAFLLVLIIFSKASTKKILFLLILTSLLFHAYLPFVSENSFGVDRWRHVGAERRLMAGKIESPALIGEVSYVKLGSVSLPKVFMMPNKFSYSNQWGMTIGLSWLTSIDILKIDQYLIWFLWSIFFTLFVYKLSQLVFEKKKLSLLITFVALFCFFSLQVGGAITVPHAIGFLPFLFFLLVFFSYLKNQDKKLWPIIIFSLVLLIFNYILYLIIALEIFVLGLVLKGRGQAKKIFLPILIIIFILSLPLLDRISGTSFFVYSPAEAIKNLPQKLVNFTNPISYFYYKLNTISFLPGLVNKISWQMIFPPLVFLFTILGLIKNWKNNLLAKILAIFLFIFLANQFISFSFMKDYRLLVSRMGNVLMLFMVIFFTAGLYWLIEKLKNKSIVVFIASIFLAALSITTYASGPMYGNVTNNELAVAKYLNQEMIVSVVNPKNVCVFDAGWRLLALESVNGMIAGNFPTDSIDFVQKERDELYRQMFSNPSREILNQTLEITGAQKCFFVANQSWLKPEIFDKIKKLLGEPVIKNNTYIWKYWK